MEEFIRNFKRLCKEHKIEVQSCIIASLNSTLGSSGGSTLNLSANALSSQTCTILGKVLAGDHVFQEIQLADCMLGEEGTKGLACGLMKNTTCRKLNLRGNNIRGKGAEALGKLLHHNNSITSLCLEWNSMGMIDDSFASFCEGVACNGSLRDLDLRNNQISHDGAAELAAGLKRNSTLHILDVRWNNIGLIGGRAFLDMLSSNKTLTSLDLMGNTVPKDIMTSIDNCIERNAERHMLMNQYTERMQTLASQIRESEKSNKIQVYDLLSTIDNRDEEIQRAKRSSSEKIGHLQLALEERKNSFNSLAAKLSLTESELCLSEQKVNDLNSLLAKVRQEMSSSESQHHSVLKKEREDRTAMETKLLKELSDSHDKESHLGIAMEELEKKGKQQTATIFDLKEQITHLQADSKVKTAQYEERIQEVKQHYRNEMREKDQIHQQEISNIRSEVKESNLSLQDKINKVEVEKLDLQSEISRLKNAAVAERAHADEQLTLMKQRLKIDEDQRFAHLEEKIRLLQSSKDEEQLYSAQQSRTIQDLQTKGNNSVIEIESLKRRLEESQQSLATKSCEVEVELSRMKQEVAQHLKKLDTEREVQTELRNKLMESDKQLSENLLSHRKQLEERDLQIASLQEKLKGREVELVKQREDEAHRVNLLQSAIMNYCGRRSIPSNQMSPQHL